MKEEFLVINHNVILRQLYLKCNILFIIHEYYINKHKRALVSKTIEKNSKLNNYLDNKTNNIEKLKNIYEETNDISEETNDISEEMNDISEETNDISEETNDISEEANDISEEMNDISEETNDILEEVDDILEEANDILEEVNDILEENEEIIFSPRNEKVTNIELETVIDINLEIGEKIDMDDTANKKCSEGCTLCYNSCNLFFTGVSFVCSFINHYITKFFNKLKNCFN